MLHKCNVDFKTLLYDMMFLFFTDKYISIGNKTYYTTEKQSVSHICCRQLTGYISVIFNFRFNFYSLNFKTLEIEFTTYVPGRSIGNSTSSANGVNSLINKLKNPKGRTS
ncbi:hypothetical protein KPH14_008513 [Odynerus spinipes]|uniref:Uncharacterized protein n=1 Tax=Odynerus spinipes TaxID=1348599 RepID=A0AAD9RS85_9HYME|nr:hypothetical protein KPH14_008513 [Odynerus spinipes]